MLKKNLRITVFFFKTLMPDTRIEYPKQNMHQ